MAPKTILITGASGFLAAWIIPALSSLGHTVIASDLSPDFRRLHLVDAEAQPSDFFPCDISDKAAFTALAVKARPDVILHLAALQIPACKADPALGARVNINGHIHALDAAREHGARLIYTSSIAAKPRPPHNAPANLYGVYKKACEEISRLYASDFGVASFGLRPHVVYGPGRDQGETSAITSAIAAAARGETYKIPWTTKTCFQYAGDIARSFVELCDIAFEGAHLSDMSDVVESTEDVITAIKAHLPEAQISADGPERISPVSGFDLSPLSTILGKIPRRSLVEGVGESLELFKRV